MSEVQIRLQKALTTLRQSGPRVFAPACDRMAREALQRAEAASLLPSELDAIRDAASQGRRAPGDTHEAASVQSPEPDAARREI